MQCYTQWYSPVVNHRYTKPYRGARYTKWYSLLLNLLLHEMAQPVDGTSYRRHSLSAARPISLPYLHVTPLHPYTLTRNDLTTLHVTTLHPYA